MVVGDAYSTKEDSVTQKKDKNLAEKREIAKYAASLIKEEILSIWMRERRQN